MRYHIKNALCLRTVDSVACVKENDIYIDGDVIASVGAAPSGFVADEVIDASDKLAIPGLINAHTHSYMTLLKNYADDLPFEKWLFERISPKEDMMTGEDGHIGALLACCEMLKTGTTCFLDMHMFPNSIADAAIKTGMRAVLSRGLVGNDDEGADRRFFEATGEMDKYKDEKLLSFKLGPHAIYTCGEKLITRVVEEAKKRKIGINIHVSETPKEFDDCVEAHGTTPVKYLDSLGLFDVPVVCVHSIYLSDEDIAILAKKGASVATCPISNLKLANGVAPIPRLVDAGVNVCLGTDGSSSNNALNMMRELGVLSVLHKGATFDPTAVDAQKAFKMATSAGAMALGFGTSLGRIAPGCLADIALIDLNRPEFTPRNNLLASLCYGASGGGVDTVFVSGEMVLQHGRLTKIDEDEVYRMASDAAKRLKLTV